MHSRGARRGKVWSLQYQRSSRYLLRYGEGWARRGFEKRLAGAALRAIQLVGAPHTCVVGRPRRA
jgi:hypothetical protein